MFRKRFKEKTQECSHNFLCTTMNIERFHLNFTMCEVDEKAYQLFMTCLLKELRLKAATEIYVTLTLPRRVLAAGEPLKNA